MGTVTFFSPAWGQSLFLVTFFIAGQEIDSNIQCVLNPFECTVLSSVFFESHLITIDKAARKLFITPQPAIK